MNLYLKKENFRSSSYILCLNEFSRKYNFTDSFNFEIFLTKLKEIYEISNANFQETLKIIGFNVNVNLIRIRTYQFLQKVNDSPHFLTEFFIADHVSHKNYYHELDLSMVDWSNIHFEICNLHGKMISYVLSFYEFYPFTRDEQSMLNIKNISLILKKIHSRNKKDKFNHKLLRLVAIQYLEFATCLSKNDCEYITHSKEMKEIFQNVLDEPIFSESKIFGNIKINKKHVKIENLFLKYLKVMVNVYQFEKNSFFLLEDKKNESLWKKIEFFWWTNKNVEHRAEILFQLVTLYLICNMTEKTLINKLHDFLTTKIYEYFEREKKLFDKQNLFTVCRYFFAWKVILQTIKIEQNKMILFNHFLNCLNYVRNDDIKESIADCIYSLILQSDESERKKMSKILLLNNLVIESKYWANMKWELSEKKISENTDLKKEGEGKKRLLFLYHVENFNDVKRTKKLYYFIENSYTVFYQDNEGQTNIFFNYKIIIMINFNFILIDLDLDLEKFANEAMSFDKIIVFLSNDFCSSNNLKSGWIFFFS